MFTVTLLEPQIPPNTGNIARLCAATDTRLEIVGDIGFKLSDRYLKRAGLDYWKYLNWKYYKDVDKYISKLNPDRIHLLTTKTNQSYTEVKFNPGDYLIFGGETKGIDDIYLKRFSSRLRVIPMSNKNVRCLNLSSSVAATLFEAIRQQTTAN